MAIGVSQRTLAGPSWLRPARTGGPRCRRGRRRPSCRCRPPRPWRGRPRARRSTPRAGRRSPTRGACASGLVRRQRSSSAPRMVCSTFLNRPSRSFMSARGTLPAASHLLGELAERVERGLGVGHRQQRLGLGEQGRASPRRCWRTPRRAWRWSRRGPRRTCPARRGTASTARRRRPSAHRRPPSTSSSGRGRRARSGPSRSTSRAPRPRRRASP